MRFGIVFVKTKYKHSWDFVEDKFIFEGFNEIILRKYVANLQEIYERDGKVEPNFLILDDLVGILSNRTDWFTNFIGTFRHLNIHIFIMVQYLVGRNAISPIMREQTDFVIMFNSKNHNTIEHLYKNYGQIFSTVKEFKEFFMANTDIRNVGKYVGLLYIEREDALESNYIPVRAPAHLLKLKLEY